MAYSVAVGTSLLRMHICFVPIVAQVANPHTNIPFVFNSALSLFNAYLNRFLAILSVFDSVPKLDYSYSIRFKKKMLFAHLVITYIPLASITHWCNEWGMDINITQTTCIKLKTEPLCFT